MKEIERLRKENEKLKARLSIADKLIKKSKELIDLYQVQIERYEKALKNSQTEN